ncbi:putative lipid II flippase FtsW [Gammaproteobacteria bacterium]|nr:putative lipid II flippase FtsW [Gammaproteobacteria bacterium]
MKNFAIKTFSSANNLRSGRIPKNQNFITEVNIVAVVSVLLLAIGLLMMTSASIEIASSDYGNPFYFLTRQLVFVGVGIVVAGVAIFTPMSFWKRASPSLLILSYILLVLVFIPGLGHEVRGSARWISLGFFNLQPSELAKLFMVFYVAAYLESNIEEIKDNWAKFFWPLGAAGFAAALLQQEPDHGAMVILLATVFCLVFLAGAKLVRVISLIIVFGVIGVAVASTKPHVLLRLVSFTDPFDQQYVYTSGYQLAQSLIAFGRGELFGIGLGNSIQKLYFLPDAHTDFVLAIIAEELGMVGVIFVLALLSTLVLNAFFIGKKAQIQNRLFDAFVSYGIGLLFTGQALINIGVNVGLLPTKGLTFPFLSYGGASLIVCCLMSSLLMRIQFETETSPVRKGTQ